ncbi:UNVERIFIED_CONTAM: protein LIFEGUARD 2 [Sesamum latifolium]|uniref:Protein LIFEGUARD 2 n=1 Tax=Sesamum latifolium TaxID=2727402 RepID=A0AAW2Y187_9LAMI
MSDPTNDVEAGSSLLYPLMQERPELRWAFIRKVYSILTIQLVTCFAALVVAVHPVAAFFATTRTGRAVYVVIVLIPLIVLCPLYCCKHKHPLNFVLLGIFTLCYGLAFGVVCAFVSVILLMFSIFQIFFPMGKFSETIYSGLTVIIFCAYIIYDTENLIKRNSYNDYIWASVALYLDILNIFLQLLKIFMAKDR